ncbi:4-amino-4-deoxychorismate lyase [Sediminivirga luteola]|uniref:4-amino-4-deoxychorismate lyase n=2 Tax=Sediminivirga luteola TaxID=1774748 RepID=A0A8J2U0M3_9MICO|nr:4-amino-4-deoxychorismate lyase [Sediminivirga luteola]
MRPHTLVGMSPAPRQSVLLLLDPGSGVTHLADPGDPVLTADDRSAHRGDGIFETVLVDAAGVHNRRRHLERFIRSAEALELPRPDPAIWESAFDEAVQAHRRAFPEAAEFSVRYALSRGPDAALAPRGWFLTAPAPAEYARQRTEGIAIGSLDRGTPAYVGKDAPWLLQGAKTLSYAVNLAAGRWAAQHGYDDALFFSHDGANSIALEFPTANLVIARGRTLLTPDPGAGLLHGTTQQGLFAAAEAAGWTTAYADLRREDILGADAAWTTSSLRRALPLASLDGEELARDAELEREVFAFVHPDLAPDT